VATYKSKEVARHQRDWSGHGEHYKIEHYLPLLKKAPALLDHGKPFVRMPNWLKKTRERLADDSGLVELMLYVEEGKFTFSELHHACLSAMDKGCVTRAVIEQEILLGCSASTEMEEPLAAEECGELGGYRLSIESPQIYDEMLNSRSMEVG